MTSVRADPATRPSTPASDYDYDVVLLSDLRYPGGTSASLAEEVNAQARAGYSTALVHADSAQFAGATRAFNRRIAHCLAAGLADLVVGERQIRTRALVIRHPAIFDAEPEIRSDIEADVTVLVANQVPADGRRPHYDVDAVHSSVERRFGPTRWAPVGPAVREKLIGSRRLELLDDDWVNILDLEEWRVDRSRPRSDRPVIGRHSRGHPGKWPVDRADLVAAYPTDPAIAVHILGGADPAIRVLGGQPANWVVHPFGAMPPQRFLRTIDFFVYYHHPDLVEAFGRNIIEAMASGCPAILPPHFEPLFGDACSYAPPQDVRAIVERLYRQPEEYRFWSEKAVQCVEDRFSAARHSERLAELIGLPAGRAPWPVREGRPPARLRTLLVSTEPDGIASLTRLLRVRDGLPRDMDAVLLVAAPVLDLAREAGALCEMLSPDSFAHGGESAGSQVAAAARRHDADVVLIDGPHLDRRLLEAAGGGGLPVVAVWTRMTPIPPAAHDLCDAVVGLAAAADVAPVMAEALETAASRRGGA